MEICRSPQVASVTDFRVIGVLGNVTWYHMASD